MKVEQLKSNDSTSYLMWFQVAVLAGAAVASAAPSAAPHFLYGGYGGYGLVAPAVAAVDTGLIVSPSSGAVTPDFTDAQKEANPEIAKGSEAIVHPVIVGKTLKNIRTSR